MFYPAVLPAQAAMLPWALQPPFATSRPDPMPDPGAPPPVSEEPGLRLRIPARQPDARERSELVFALLDGPGLGSSEDVCVEALLRRLKALGSLVSPNPPRSLTFRRLPCDPADPGSWARARAAADLVWLRVAADSPLVGRALDAIAGLAARDKGVLALMRRDVLLLSPDPATLLQARDALVLRGAR